jgi:hypothetical protein
MNRAQKSIQQHFPYDILVEDEVDTTPLLIEYHTPIESPLVKFTRTESQLAPINASLLPSIEGSFVVEGGSHTQRIPSLDSRPTSFFQKTMLRALEPFFQKAHLTIKLLFCLLICLEFTLETSRSISRKLKTGKEAPFDHLCARLNG